jgi:hypothetical protein
MATVGPSCTMNSHETRYLDPVDVENPAFNYERHGVKCSFFLSGNEHTTIPYPEDITLAPVSDPCPPSQSSDISAIISLLNQQKSEAESHRQHQKQQMRLLQEHQDRQMRLLQDQVNSLSLVENIK